MPGYGSCNGWMSYLDFPSDGINFVEMLLTSCT